MAQGDPERREAGSIKLIVIVSRLLIVYGLFAWWWFTPTQEQVKPPEWTPQEKAMVIQRLKYH